RAIAGLEPAASGRVRIGGQDQAGLPPERRPVGLVFQDLALFPHRTVAGNLDFALHGLPRAERRERIRELLALTGLGDLAERYPHELSGGQQQRVAVARTLARRPALLLLDEPFAALDAPLRRRLREELAATCRRLGISALLVTHDREEGFAFADRLGVMREGRLEQWDGPYELYHRPANPFVAEF
ncbi:MAG: ABC transporter ATP-binding protein, partial [Elioraea sp.]|nr:ABC transporter ATP-binding protein [Elioraea sp.]